MKASGKLPVRQRDKNTIRLRLAAWLKARLSDEESKAIFDARLRYALSQDKDAFLDELLPLLRNYRMENYDMYARIKRFGTRQVVIYGAGVCGRRNKRALDMCGMEVLAFSDSDSSRIGRMFEGVPVVAPETLTGERYQNALFLVSSVRNTDEICAHLASLGIPEERIHCPRYVPGHVMVNRPMQYFDVFKPHDDEVFVDIGAYDGETAENFSRWTAGKYQRIYCLEPMKEMQEQLRQRTAMLHDVTLLPIAAWNKKAVLCFREASSRSQVAREGEMVEAMPLDSLVDGPVSFIKMDIEGSERRALRGSVRLIRTYRPRLAVCIYHKRWDLLELPLYVMHLAPGYRLTIRHYGANIYETVLLAEPVGQGSTIKGA